MILAMDMEDPKRTVHGRDHGIPPNYNLRRNGRRRLLSRQNVLKLTYANVGFKKFSGGETPGPPPSGEAASNAAGEGASNARKGWEEKGKG